jgi:signal peptidase
MNKILGNILSAIVFTALLGLCLTFVAIRVLGFGTFIVTGGSMEPTIHLGSLVILQPVDPHTVQIGDIITFQQYGQTTTHRVIAIGQSSTGLTFKTKGDANTVADPEDKTFPGEVGVVRLATPGIGYAALYIQAYWRLALTLVAAITFFGCAGGLVFRKPQVAPVLVRRPVSGAPVQRAKRAWTVDADETWNAHREWLRRTHRNTLVA